MLTTVTSRALNFGEDCKFVVVLRTGTFLLLSALCEET